MHIPTLKFHIELDAVVRTALGKRFGIEFLKMDTVDKKRLQNHIETLISTGPAELRRMFLDV